MQPAMVVRAWGGVPVVSCILPTHNRCPFVPHAIPYFLRQDYPNKALILVDDGTNPISNLLPKDPQGRYLCVNQKQTVGANGITSYQVCKTMQDALRPAVGSNKPWQESPDPMAVCQGFDNMWQTVNPNRQCREKAVNTLLRRAAVWLKREGNSDGLQ